MDEKVFTAYRRSVHPVFCIFLGFLSAWAFDCLFRVGILQTVFTAGLPGPPFGFLLVAAIACVEEAVTTNTLARRPHAGRALRVRELLIVAASGLVIFMLMSGSPFHGDFRLEKFQIIYPFVLMLIGWGITRYVHGLLVERERYLVLVAGKKGAELRETVQKTPVEVADACAALEKAKRFILVAEAICLMLLSVTSIANAGTSAAWVVPSLLYSFFSAAAFVIVNAWLREQRLLAEAVVRGGARMSARVGFSLTLLAALFLPCLAAGPGPLLSPSHLNAVLNAISSIYVFVAMAVIAIMAFIVKPLTKTTVTQSSSRGVFEEPLAAEASTSQSPVFQILGIVLVALIIAGVLIFLFRPLFSRKTPGEDRRHPLRLLRDRFLELVSLIASVPFAVMRLVAGKRRGGFLRTRADRGASRTSSRVWNASQDRQRRERERHQSKAVREFSRVLRWGSVEGAPFHSSEGPATYAARLARRTPDLQIELESAARIFEELVFSRAPTAGRMRDLTMAVNRIVRAEHSGERHRP